MILEGNHYTFSGEYSALDDELFDIHRILKALKGIVIGMTGS